MKILISQVVAANSFFEKISKEALNIQTCYKFAKISIALKNEVSFYQTQYSKILEEYALHEGNNFIFNDQGNIKIIPGKEEECKRKIFELENLEVEIPDIEISLDDLRGLKNSIHDMISLMPFIKE